MTLTPTPNTTPLGAITVTRCSDGGTPAQANVGVATLLLDGVPHAVVARPGSPDARPTTKTVQGWPKLLDLAQHFD